MGRELIIYFSNGTSKVVDDEKITEKIYNWFVEDGNGFTKHNHNQIVFQIGNITWVLDKSHICYMIFRTRE